MNTKDRKIVGWTPLYITALAKIEGMKAANELARCYGDKPTYDKGCFDLVAQKYAEFLESYLKNG